MKSQGVWCGRCHARTLMRRAGVSAKQSKKYRVTTASNHRLPIALNHLDRQFTVDAPNRIWVSDITYIWTKEGWLYLAVVIDLYSRQIVGWSLNSRITTCLVIDALRMAIWRRNPGPNLIFHSDRGSQYCSDEIQRMLRSNKMICSMSQKGNCWDNAVAESYFGSLKTERLFGMTYRTRTEARRDIIDYTEMFYNRHRLHSYLGYLSPIVFVELGELNEVA